MGATTPNPRSPLCKMCEITIPLKNFEQENDNSQERKVQVLIR